MAAYTKTASAYCATPASEKSKIIVGRDRLNWAARRIEVLESPAYRALSRSAHMVISRIEIELAHHGGNDNKRLPVTTEQFVRYGTHRTSVAPAIREAEALGFIQVTERGRGGNAEHRSPNLFYLTYAHTRDSRRRPPTDEWDRIQTLQEAHRIAPAARGNKSQPAVERGKRSWRKQQQKTKPGTANARSSVLNTGTEKAESPVRQSGITVSGEETERLSISRGGEHRDKSSSPTCNTAQDGSHE